MNNDINLVRDLLSELRGGEPKREGPLTLVPFFTGAPAKDYLVASEAFQSGLLTIEEVGEGQVPNISVVNGADLPVLFLDGEHLEGARQNRILNVSVMVGAKTKTILPVSCVEQGRWHYEGGSGFKPSEDHSYARLRHMQTEAVVAAARTTGERRPSQAAVWQEVAVKQRELGVQDSDTGAMRDAYESRRDLLERIRVAFPSPTAGQTGVLACIGGRPFVADLFDKPETLAKVWGRLISGYAMDACDAPDRGSDQEAASRFLSQAARSDMRIHDAVGHGRGVSLVSTRAVGSALVWEGGIPHLSLFARDDHRAQDGSRIERPAQRRRMRHFHG